MNINLSELKNRILMSLLYLIIFRIGSFIPIPSINTNIIFNNLFKSIKNGYIVNMFNMFSGGSLRRASIFSLGTVPYTSSSMIIELLCKTFNYFKEIKNNEINKYKINIYLYLLTIILSIFQSIITILNLPNLFYIEDNLKFNIDCKIILSILSLVTGTIFLIWLSNQITNNGVGNGISIIMFSGIISEIPKNLINLFNKIKNNNINLYLFIFAILIIFNIINFIIFVETGQRKIIVNYYKKNNYKNNFLDIKSTHLPIKLNISGITPIFFSSSIIIFPIIIITYLERYFKYNFLTLIINLINTNTLIYNIIYIYVIFNFCNLYSSIVLNSDEISNNLKKSGAYISGIRPGNQTSIYIKEIINKLTFISSFYINIIYLIPILIKNLINNIFMINSISLLLIIIVILDIINNIKIIMISNKYYYLLKKINIKNNFNINLN